MTRAFQQFSRFSVPYLVHGRHVELVLGLRPGAGDVQRPGRRDTRLTGLDKLRDGDVDDSLAAGLATRDTQQAVDLPRSSLARRAGELVRCCYSPQMRRGTRFLRASAPLPLNAGPTVSPSAAVTTQCPVVHVHDRSHSYSLYATAGIAMDRDCPGRSGGYPPGRVICASPSPD